MESFSIQNNPLVPSGSQYYPEGFLQVPLPPMSGNTVHAWSQNIATHRSESFEQETPYFNAYSGQGLGGLFEEGQGTHGPVSDTRCEEKVADWEPLPVNIMLAPPQIETTFSSGPPEQYTFDLSSFSDQQFPLWPAVVANPGGSFAIQNEPVVSPTDLKYYPGSLQQASLPPPMPGNDALA
ncbi:hypothetical protein C0995_011328 [Termitomyces sp. Mi166|nr:hypothetical protein C0995_011328 [Termitomyces sp. Mi166\